MHAQGYLPPIVTLPHNAAEHLVSYRCRTRPYDHACRFDSSADSFVQIKARNADDAFYKASLVVPEKTIVTEVERLDG